MPHRLALQLEALGQPFRTALPTAARLGYAGVQLAAAGAFLPSQLSQTGRREVRYLVQSHHVQLAAVAAPLERGLDELPGLEARLDYLRQTMQLAVDLGPGLVVLAAGQVPSEPTTPAFILLKQALLDLARVGDRIGCRLALLAGGEPPERLRDFLAGFDTGSLTVALDPATLLLAGHDPAAAARTFASSLALVLARDARPGRLDRASAETALGAGAVDWLALLGALEEFHYQGWYCVRRQPVADAVGEAQRALAFLRTLGA